MLRHCDDPECPACGCRRATQLDVRPRFATAKVASEHPRRGERWDAPKPLWRCGHCGNRYRAAVEEKQEREPAPPALPIWRSAVVPPCPACGTKNHKVASTQRPIRKHRCECGHRFESYEPQK